MSIISMPGGSSQPDPGTTVPGTPAVLGVPPALTVVNPDGSSEACRLVGLDCKVGFRRCPERMSCLTYLALHPTALTIVNLDGSSEACRLVGLE